MNSTKRCRWLRIFSLIVILVLVVLMVPTVVLGELIYSASRSAQYPDLDGFNQTSLRTQDGVDITVWYTQTRSKVVLVVHGHGDHSEIIYNRYGKVFERFGFDLVLIDLRNHGRSEDKPPITMGIDERKDVTTVLRWMEDKWQAITLFGSSMGSIAAILAYNETEIASSVILDSSFSDPIQVMNNNFEKNNLIQPWRWLVVQYLTQIRTGVDEFPDILTILNNIAIPTLVVHGSADMEAPPSFLLHVDDLNNDNIQTELIRGGEHSQLHDQRVFVETVAEFLGVE